MNTQQALQLAFQHLNYGNLGAAAQLFNSVLQQESQNFAALNGRGFVALQQNALPQAHADLQASLTINPKQPFAYKIMGIVLGAMGQFDAAMQAFDSALALDAKDSEVYFNRANFRFQAGQAQEALTDLDMAIKLKGSYLEARSNRANLLFQLGEFARAEKDLDYLVGKVTNNPDIWVALGLARYKQNKYQGAMHCNERALRVLPNHPDALLNSSSAMHDQGEYHAALLWADKAIAATPQRAEAHYARAQALMAMHWFEGAVAAYTRAIDLNPAYAEAWMGRGLAKARMHRLEAAVADYDQAVALRPDYDEALNNLGAAFLKIGRYLDAVECLKQSEFNNPGNFLAIVNEARALSNLKRMADAKNCYLRAKKINPDIRWMQGELVFLLASMCDWSAHQHQSSIMIDKINLGEKVCQPFSVLATKADLKIRKVCSEIYSQDKFPHGYQHVKSANFDSCTGKLNLAYLSSDFYNHATSQLIAELFELHDRSRFNVYGICYGLSPCDEMRDRVIKGFDKFFEVVDVSDKGVADLLRSLDIHIAIDLKGHTKDNRLGILSNRVAPVQIHYLGYPGTIGSDFIDYLVADTTVVPVDHQHGYTEKIIYLPDTYQVNDRLRSISNSAGVRSDHGLPEEGFVFCCFNNNWKITADVFDIWMRLLKQVDGSVLWLLEDNEDAVNGLITGAICRGIEADRLVFAKRATLADHLARHAHADLFLDTFYYNAHTTASDALWAGLPLVTKLGDAFASRVAASLLKAIGLPELITDTPESYEALALDLATHREKLLAIKRRLKENKNCTPLFETPRFARNIESAYEVIWSRYQAGLPPDHVYI